MRAQVFGAAGLGDGARGAGWVLDHEAGQAVDAMGEQARAPASARPDQGDRRVAFVESQASPSALTKVEAVIINSPQAGTTCGAASAGMSPGPGACSRTRAPGSFASSPGKRPTTTVGPGPPQPIGAKPSSSSPASVAWLSPALMAATPTARARGLWAWAQAAGSPRDANRRPKAPAAGRAFDRGLRQPGAVLSDHQRPIEADHHRLDRFGRGVADHFLDQAAGPPPAPQGGVILGQRHHRHAKSGGPCRVVIERGFDQQGGPLGARLDQGGRGLPSGRRRRRRGARSNRHRPRYCRGSARSRAGHACAGPRRTCPNRFMAGRKGRGGGVPTWGAISYCNAASIRPPPRDMARPGRRRISIRGFCRTGQAPGWSKY